MENERLQQHVADLRKRALHASSLASTSSPTAYDNTIMQPSYIPTQSGEAAQSFYNYGIHGGGYNGMTSDMTGAFNGAGNTSRGPVYAWNPVMEENLSEDSMRKKVISPHR